MTDNLLDHIAAAHEYTHVPTIASKSILAYCDYIAHKLVSALSEFDTNGLLTTVSKPQYDLDADGVFISTKKTVHVTDRFGKKYIVTVEEA
jgi:hypothetical protein